MAYVITDACVDVMDRACVEECPVDCIYEGERMFYINPNECIECGACAWSCPVSAIYQEDDIPPHLAEYQALNEAFFEGLGPLGGASVVGRIERDLRPQTGGVHRGR